MPQKNDDRRKKCSNTGKRLPAQNSLLIRILVGAYLLYTSYSLLDGFINGSDTNKYILGAFIIAFAVIGLLLVFFSGRDLYNGKYAGGRLDSETQNETENEEDEDRARQEGQTQQEDRNQT